MQASGKHISWETVVVPNYNNVIVTIPCMHMAVGTIHDYSCSYHYDEADQENYDIQQVLGGACIVVASNEFLGIAYAYGCLVLCIHIYC